GCAGWGAWWIDRRSRRVTDHSRFRGAGPRVPRPAPMPSHLFSPAGARASASRTAEALTGLLEAAHRRFALAGARRQKTPRFLPPFSLSSGSAWYPNVDTRVSEVTAWLNARTVARRPAPSAHRSSRLGHWHCGRPAGNAR